MNTTKPGYFWALVSLGLLFGGVRSDVPTPKTTTGTIFDLDCSQKFCEKEFEACRKDSATSTSCEEVARCIVNDERSGGNTDTCMGTTSLLESHMDSVEVSLYECVKRNSCILKHEGTVIPSFLQVAEKSEKAEADSGDMPEVESFLDMSSEQLAKQEAVAKAAEQRAEAAWDASRKKTESLLQKVHEEMSDLNKDLKKTTDEQEHDLALLEDSRKQENEELAKAEQKIKEAAKEPIQVPSVASFLDTGSNFLSPLRKAAEQARAFASEIRKHAIAFQQLGTSSNENSNSFLETKNNDDDAAAEIGGFDAVDAEKAEHGLSLAQQALSKLNADIASQRKALQEDEAREKKELEREEQAGYVPRSEAVASFIQLKTDLHNSPLSHESLMAWREKFEEKLEKARLAAGIKTPMSFLQNTQTPGAMSMLERANEAREREDEREVESLQSSFNEKMAKLRQDTLALQNQAKAEVEKSKDIEARIESNDDGVHAEVASALDGSLGSLMQVKGTSFNTYDAAKEEERIRELQRKWDRDAAKISNSVNFGNSGEKSEFDSLLEQQKEREEASEAELNRMKKKLNEDLEKMHNSIAAQSISSRINGDSDSSAGVSFLQLGNEAQTAQTAENAASTSDDPMEKAKALLKKLDQILAEKPPKELTDKMSSFFQKSDETTAAESALDKAEGELDKLKAQLKDDALRFGASSSMQLRAIEKPKSAFETS